MPDDDRSILSRALVPVGVAYLVYMTVQPPPARWVGIGCLLVLAPFLGGWLLGRYGGVGPWADG